jgi:hypothetical protein
MHQPTLDECKRQVFAMNNTVIIAIAKCVQITVCLPSI